MLETLDLDLALSKKKYKARLPELQSRLHQLQRANFESGLATIVVVSGWDASGRGSTIKKLTERLEPRAFTHHLVREPRTFEKPLPWMWRFWQSLPNWGEMGIYQGSWYSGVIRGRAEDSLTESRWLRACRDIRFFEQTLDADRYLLVKFFLHIDREEQRRRLQKVADDPLEAWRLDDGDWRRHERYDDYFIAMEETLQATEAEWGPWQLVEAHDKYWTRMRVFEHLIQRIEETRRLRGEPPVDYESVESERHARDEDLDP